jgi:hypothetical protein
LPSEFVAAARKCLLQIGHRLRNEAFNLAPKRSTDLARSIIVRRTGNLRVLTGPSVYYGLYVHEGTGLYGPNHAKFVIKPRNKKALKFKVNGHDVFASQVEHPGQKPQPFMDDAWDRIDDWAHDKLAADLGDEVLKEIQFAAGKRW